MAIESFRQLILDAQAMMDPDFAGKLSADVAAGAESDEEADTGFAFGSAETDSASAESATSFDFSGGRVPLVPILGPGDPTIEKIESENHAKSATKRAGLSQTRRRRHSPGADPLPHRPHRLHQSSGDRRLAGGLQPH